MTFFMENIDQLWLPLLAAAAIVGGVCLGLSIVWGRRKKGDLESRAEKRALRMVKEMEAQGKTSLLDEKRVWHETRASHEKELTDQRLQIEENEQNMVLREKEFEERLEQTAITEDRLSILEEDLGVKEKRVQTQEQRLAESTNEYRSRLETIAKLSVEEAREQLHKELMGEVKQQAAQKLRDLMDQTREDASREAKKVIALAINRCAADQSTQSSVAVVPLPNEQIKARIIGKDGRNIRTFESTSGVKVMVDDTPEAVVISCFDPIQREIARTSMEQLVSTGKITQNRIEEVIAKSREELEERIMKEGTAAVKELKLEPMHKDLINLVGRLRFRTSYGQNALFHSKEVAYLTGMMAVEIGIDQSLARRCGLLHDIGKAVDHEMEGSHPEIGLAYAKRCGESMEVQNAIEAHHHDEEAEVTSPITFLVAAADAISGARPGARRNDPEDYTKRVVELEELAKSFPGVADVYAINAGREVRVMVKPDEVDDDTANILAFDIAQKIRSELTYPGQIKVVVIRGKIAHGWTNQAEGKRQERKKHYGRNRGNRQQKSSGGHAAAG